MPTTLPSGTTGLCLACDAPVPSDPTSFVRGLGPLNEMAREDRRLTVILPEGPSSARGRSWDWIGRGDILYLQRPHLAAQAEAAQQAKMMNRPVWVDWDDDILRVDRSNPAYRIYAKESVRQVLHHLLKVADVITVSTEQLRRRLLEEAAAARHDLVRASRKIRVVPNACQWPFDRRPRRRVITWRGTSHHVENLASVVPHLQSLSRTETFSSWHWHFLGDPSWLVHKGFPSDRVSVHASPGIFQYMAHFFSLASWVHIVPLVDTAFNRAKSNLAWLEATAAGAVVIAPDWEEWRRPGVLHYGSPDDLATQLAAAVALYREGAFHPNVTLSRSYIAEHLLLGTLNQRRWALLHELKGCASPGTFPSGAREISEPAFP